MGSQALSTLLVIVAITAIPGRRHHCALLTPGLTIPLGRSRPQRKLSNDTRTEEPSKARTQEIHKTMVGQEVALEWGLSWEWHCSELE